MKNDSVSSIRQLVPIGAAFYCLVFCASAQAAIVIYESFNQTAATNMEGTTADLGLGAWDFINGTNSPVEAGSLTYGAVPTSGNKFYSKTATSIFAASTTTSLNAGSGGACERLRALDECHRGTHFFHELQAHRPGLGHRGIQCAEQYVQRFRQCKHSRWVWSRICSQQHKQFALSNREQSCVRRRSDAHHSDNPFHRNHNACRDSDDLERERK